MKKITFFTTLLLLFVTGGFSQVQPCDPVDQFSEKFDAAITIPACWTRVGTTGTVSFNGNGLSLPNAMFMSSTSGASRSVVAMPLVANSKTGVNRLRFQLKAESTAKIGGILEVGYLTNRTDANTFRAISQATANSALSFESFTIDYGTLNDANVYLAFRHKGDSNTFGVYIDNVYWEPQTACGEPKNLVSTKVTESTATVSWTAPEIVPATGYDYYYSTSPVEPIATTQKSGSVSKNSTSVNLTGLAPATVYYVWVRSDCGASKSAWFDVPVSFRTLCNPSTSLPFTEGFENVQAGNNMFPPCWNYSVASGSPVNSESHWAAATDLSFYGTKSLSLSTNSNSSDNWAFTPQFALVAGTSYTFSYYAISGVKGGAGPNLEVKVGNGATAADMTIPLTSQNSALFTNWTKRFAVFTPSVSGNYTFGLHVVTGIGSGGINFDEFRLEVTPSCAEPLNVSVANNEVTSTTVKVRWTEPTNIPTGGYEYFYSNERVKPDDAVAAKGSVASGNFANVEGLTPAKTYYIWVRSVCGSVKGGWAGYATFLTKCGAVSTFSHDFELPGANDYFVCYKKLLAPSVLQADNVVTPPSGTGVLFMPSDNITPTNVLQLPELDNLGNNTHRLKLKARGNFSSATNLHVGYLTTEAQESSYVDLGTFVVPNNATYTSFEIAPKGLPAGVRFLALKILGGAGTASGSFYVDDLSWTPIPACLDPNALKTSLITSTSAKVTWTATAPTSIGYEYFYSTSPTTPSDAVTISGSVGQGVTSVTIPGLASSTKYYVWVRTICSETSRSPWSDFITFTTKCPQVDNFSENFDNVTSPAIPNCFNKVGFGGVVQTTTFDIYSAPNALRLGSQSVATAGDFNGVVALPPVNHSADGTHRIVVKAKTRGVASAPLQFGYLTDADDKGTFVSLASFTVTQASYLTYTFKLPVNAAITPFLAFKNAVTQAADLDIIIDDVVYEPIPACTDPKDVAFADITSSSVTAFWSDGDEENPPLEGYQYYVTKSNVPPTADTPPTGTLDFGIITVNLTNLDYNSTYFFWVRSACTTVQFSPWTGISFKTTCPSIITPPYSEDFSNYIISTNPAAICWTPGAAGTLATGPADNKVSKISLGNFLNASGAGANSLRMQFNGFDSATAWMIAPPFNLSAGGYKVAFDYGLTEAGNTNPKYIGFDDKVQLVMLVNNTLPWVPVTTFDKDSPVDNTRQTFIADLPTAAASVQFAFFVDYGAISDNVAYDFFADNFKVFTGSLGVADIKNNSFTFYPNPVRDILNISHDLNISHVAVYNLLGQEVFAKSMNTNQTQIDMSNLTSGTYLVRVMVDDQVKTIKVVKE